jgi:hypothetical protein
MRGTPQMGVFQQPVKIAIQEEYPAFLYILVKGSTMRRYHTMIRKGMSTIPFNPRKFILTSFGFHPISIRTGELLSE